MAGKWTEQEIAFLKANHRKMSARQIGAALGRSVQAVHSRAYIVGITFRWTADQDEFLRKHARKGWQWCAKRLGKSATAIHNRVRRLGIQRDKGKWLQIDLARLKRLHSQGTPNIQLAQAFNCDPETIRVHLRRMGLKTNRRNERNRMNKQRANLIRDYGVENVAQARKVRQRRARLAALTTGAQTLAKSLSEALSKAEGNPCQASSP